MPAVKTKPGPGMTSIALSSPSSKMPASSPRRKPTKIAAGPPSVLRPDRLAADAGASRCLRHDELPRMLGTPDRHAARLAALRRALGPPLARRRPLRRDQQLRARRRQAARLAVSRLCHPLVQRRQAVRPVRQRAARRRRVARADRRLDSIATGFYRLGVWDDEPADRDQAMYDGFDDIVTTIGQGILGLTFNCARCHDHKIDPIPQADYYSWWRSSATSRRCKRRARTSRSRSSPATEAAGEKYDRTSPARLGQAQRVAGRDHAAREEVPRAPTTPTGDAAARDIDDLEYRFYRDTWDKLPTSTTSKPKTQAKLEVGPVRHFAGDARDSFGFVFTGMLKVPADGEYTFYARFRRRLAADHRRQEGRRVRRHSRRRDREKTAKVELKQGRVPIRVDYFQGPIGG